MAGVGTLALVPAPTAPSAHLDRYNALSPVARVVAQVYGVAASRALSISRVHRALRLVQLRVDGRVVTLDQARRANNELTKAGLLVDGAARSTVEYVRDGRTTTDGWALSLTGIAHADGTLEAIVRGLEATRQQRGYYYDDGEDDMQFRRHLVSRDFDSLDKLYDVYDTPPWGMLADPLRADLISTLPQRHVASALAGCLERTIAALLPPDPLIEVCQAKGLAAVLLDDIAFIRVLQGRFDDAENVFATLPPSARDSKAARTALAATQAFIATLRGDDEGALRGIQAAMAHEKAGTRKRNVFVCCHAFALSLLALVRNDTPTTRDLFEQTLRAAERVDNERFTDDLDLVANAARAKSKRGVFSTTPTKPRLDALFDGLLSCWLDDFHPNPEHRRALLTRLRDQAATGGYAWVAAECEEVLRRYTLRHGRKAAAEAAAKQTARGHEQLHTTTLADLAVPLPEWEFSLKELEQLAHDAKAKASGGKAKAVSKRRLVWDLQTAYDDILLDVREQRQLKNGDWSKGRRVAFKRLATESSTMDFLLEQDRDAIAALSARQYWGGGQDLYAGQPSLFALAGHPHVFNRDGEPMDVVRREPELSIDEQDDGQVLVRVEPHAGDSEREYRATLPTKVRCEVTRFTPAHRRLFNAIPEDGLRLPAGAKPRLLDAVSALVGDIRVQSDSGGAATALEVAADAAPWVRLEPLDAGLTVAVLVEPIVDSGICFPPGAGGVTVFANQDGQSVQAARNLAAEREGVERLARECQLAPLPTELEPLMLPEPEQCLELLQRLKAAEARCKWPKGEPFRIVAQATTRSLALTVKSAEEWMQASGKLAIDEDRVLDLKRLFRLLEASPGSRFLHLQDGEFVALTNTFRRQLDDFASLAAPGAKDTLRLNPLAALALDDLLAEAEVDADEGWLDLRAKLAEAQAFEPTVPSTLQAELRPYQVEGYGWLARLARWGAGACLADDMGLGKTVQTLAALLDRAPQGPALVVAPTSVVANWVDEARRFAPTLNVKLYVGLASARADLLAEPAPFDLYVTTYGVAQNDIDALAEVQWRSAVLDEAQAIKNPAAKRTRAMRRLQADFRVITTGTPIQNNLVDLHSLFSFVNPGLLGTLQQFRSHFQVPIERDGDALTQGRLRRLIAPFVLRRLKADVLDDLPERTEITLHVEMSAEEATLYEALRQRAVEELEAARKEDPEMGEGARRVQVLAHLTRLRLACCNPRLVMDRPGAAEGLPAAAVRAAGAIESAKLATFATTLAELLENRHKVLVFSQFVMHLKLVEEYLQREGVTYQYLDGSTPAKVRTKRIAAFQAGEGDVFLISLKAGGVGLNLTAADYVIHMDPWWNPAVEDQASDRAHRIGQTRPVTIYRLVTEGTIEEQIVDLHHHKRDLADQLLEGTDAAGRLNADELLELLRQPLGA